MPRRLPSLKSLSAFEATARLKSVTAAANELFVTPGAVSRQVSMLEEWIDQPLMHRSPQGINLTERGEKLALKLRDVFEDIARAIREAERQDENTVVNINLYPTFTIQWMMPRLAEFHATNPKVDLRIKTSLQEPNFHGGDIDMAVIIAKDDPPGLYGIPLFERVFSPVCSPKLLKRCPGETPGEALVNERLLLSDRHIGLWKKWLEMSGISIKKLQKGVKFENSTLAWQAARNGAGFAMGQEALLQSDFSEGRLVSPFTESILDDRFYRLVCRDEEKNIPAIQAVFSWFEQEKEQHSPSDRKG